MNAYILLLAIAGALVLAFVIIFIVIPLLIKLMVHIDTWIRHLVYAREARRHNAEALAFRLQRTNWEGYPLPMERMGEIKITREMLTQLPRKRDSQILKIYQDRARDLNVDIWIDDVEDPIGDTVMKIYWRPSKKKVPRAKY